MLPTSSRPHGDVGPFLTNKPWRFVVDALWGCGQRDSVVHQIHRSLLPEHRFSVTASSLGRDHAPWRIDLYTAGTLRPLTMIDIHVSREAESCVGDQTTSGLRGAIKLAGRRSPRRIRGKLDPFFLTLCCCALRQQAAHRETAKTQSPTCEQGRRYRPCGRACRLRRTVAATRSTTCSPVGSATKTKPARPVSIAQAWILLCQCHDRG